MGAARNVGPVTDQTISIIGSCVTRDALEVVDGLQIGEYIARSSLASIASEASPWATSLELSFTDRAYPWHRRVARADLDKTHEDQIERMADGHVVIDLIEERVEIVETKPGHFVTRSQILAQMTDFDRFAPKRIRIFSRDGFEAWSDALPRFVSMLGRHLPQERTLIHRAMYASDDEAGQQANHYLGQMYDALAASLPGADLITPSPELLRAEPNHRWGTAPFHYIDDYYFDIAARILAACGIELPFKQGFTFVKAPPASQPVTE